MRIFSNDHHTIYQGDAVQVLKSALIPNSSVDLVFADPPYNIGKNFNGKQDKWASEEAYYTWVSEWLDLCIDKLRPSGSLYLMCSTQCFAPIDLVLRQRLSILSRIVWYYDSSSVQAKCYFGSLWEPIFHCVVDPNQYTFNSNDILVEAKTGSRRKLIDYRKMVPTQYNTDKVPGNAWYFDKVPGNAWYFPRVRYRMPEYEEHPTQKPLQLLDRIITASSNAGETILDPFAGTFTAAQAAANLNRKSLSIEIDEDYTNIGIRRLGIAIEDIGERQQSSENPYRGTSEAMNLRLFER